MNKEVIQGLLDNSHAWSSWNDDLVNETSRTFVAYREVSLLEKLYDLCGDTQMKILEEYIKIVYGVDVNEVV